MKKKLFFSVLLLGLFLTANAQSSCATALNLPTGVTVVGDLTGSYEDNCWEPASADAANWYMYTATANGAVRINTDLPANDGDVYSDDTRVSVYSGTCTSLSCWAFSDDINIETQNYLTDFEFQVLSGETYYIAFDNNWNPLGFEVEVTFTEFSCFPITGGLAYVGTPTPTEVTIEWGEAINSPLGYEVLYGAEGFDPETEGELIDGLTTPQVTFTNLSPETNYDFYVRTVCTGDEFSTWVGPITFATPVAPTDIPYSYGFEDADGTGWTVINAGDGGNWTVEQTGEDLQSYEGDYFAYAGANANASDSWLFSRGVNLTQGTSYSVSYYLKKYALAGSGNVNNLEVTIGTLPTVEDQTTILGTLNDYSEEEYVQQTHTFSVPATGVYYLGFNYTAPAHIETNYGVLTIDNFLITTSLRINEIVSEKLSVYPNPTNNMVNIVNIENILLNGAIITDINGRTVKSVKFEGVSDTSVNVSDLASGVYMMTISSDKGSVTKKIVKN